MGGFLHRFFGKPARDYGPGDDILRTLQSILRGLGDTVFIVCEDGFRLGVGVGESRECAPRSDRGPWVSAEVALESHDAVFDREAVLYDADHQDDEEFPPYPGEGGGGRRHTSTVYRNVCLTVIARLIRKHGGIESWTSAKGRRGDARG